MGQGSACNVLGGHTKTLNMQTRIFFAKLLVRESKNLVGFENVFLSCFFAVSRRLL